MPDASWNGWRITTTVLLALIAILFAAATLLPMHNLKVTEAVQEKVNDLKVQVAVNNQRYETIQAELASINVKLQAINENVDSK